MERIKENAWCCGAGGGVKTAYPDFALWTAEERLQEMGKTGAEALVTCCPHCETNFRDTIEQKNGTMKVYDLVELVLPAIQGKEQG
jgi:Fe-S oxidoreductase